VCVCVCACVRVCVCVRVCARAQAYSCSCGDIESIGKHHPMAHGLLIVRAVKNTHFPLHSINRRSHILALSPIHHTRLTHSLARAVDVQHRCNRASLGGSGTIGGCRGECSSLDTLLQVVVSAPLFAFRLYVEPPPSPSPHARAHTHSLSLERVALHDQLTTTALLAIESSRSYSPAASVQPFAPHPRDLPRLVTLVS
jgi:hypothetical protein